MKTSSGRQIIALYEEMGVAESNGDVRILIRSFEISACMHAQYKTARNSPE